MPHQHEPSSRPGPCVFICIWGAQHVSRHILSTSSSILKAWVIMWVFVEDTLLSWLFSEVCVLQGSVWDAAALWTWGQCRDMAPLPRNVFISYCSQECIYSLLYLWYCPIPWETRSKVLEITEISLPHRPKNHESRPHDFQGTAQRIEFNNNNKKV